jgi:hypothetical protein
MTDEGSFELEVTEALDDYVTDLKSRLEAITWEIDTHHHNGFASAKRITNAVSAQDALTRLSAAASDINMSVEHLRVKVGELGRMSGSY